MMDLLAYCEALQTSGKFTKDELAALIFFTDDIDEERKLELYSTFEISPEQLEELVQDYQSDEFLEN